ncbi:MAG: hypothetical protein MZV64_62440 [Ignavibacteriales bacterium]|nr:hypothetical protein [Ignavibacteriales bacterium]
MDMIPPGGEHQSQRDDDFHLAHVPAYSIPIDQAEMIKAKLSLFTP